MQPKSSIRVQVTASLLLLTLASCGASGPKGARVHAQRPFISRDTHTTEDKVLSVEGGAAVVTGHESEVPILLKYGIGPQSEFFVGTSPYYSVDHNNTQPDGSGWGDTFVGIRHRMRERDMFSPAYGFQVQTKLPTGRPKEGLGSGETDWFGALMANQMYNGFDTTLYYQLGIIGEAYKPSSNHEHTLAIQTRREVNSGTTAFGEVGFITEPEIDRNETTIMGGVSFLLDSFTSVDLAIRVGVGDDAQDFQVLFGISRALGMIFFPEDEAQSSLRR
ncbi:MAG: hypothetical protein ACI9F9_002104 [Candidatus Paceibacteria bacterium]|jgi:hypothetical protein